MKTEAWCVQVSIVLVMGFLFGQGCERKEPENQPSDAAPEIVCPQLFQRSDSLADALAFIEVPEDRMESSLVCVRSRGRLADGQQLVFANELFSLRQSKNTERFKSLLSDATRRELDEPDNSKQMVRHHLEEVRNGTFLYGEWDVKFFAAFHTLTQDELDTLGEHVSFAPPPTHAITFYHFHKPNSMLIGTRNYLIQNGDSYRIVTETLRKPPDTAETDT